MSAGVPLSDPATGLADLDEYEAPDAIVHRSRAMTPLTWGLLFLLTAVGGFLVGAKVQGSRSTTTTGAVAATGRAATAAGAAGSTTTVAGRGGQGSTASTVAGGQAGQGAQATGGRNGGVPAGATVGQVKLVDGTNLYLQDTQGDVVKVITAPGLAVAVSKPGTIADLQPGDTVIVLGDTNADGSVNATSVRTGGAGAGFGGGGGGGGGGGTGGGTGGTGGGRNAGAPASVPGG